MLAAGDAAAARALLQRAPAGAPWMGPFAEALASALSSHDETRAAGVVSVVGARGAPQLAGVIVYGSFAGASGAGRLHGVFVDPGLRWRGIGRTLLVTAMADARERGERFVLAEVAGDDTLAAYRAFLLASGFREEARAADLVRDGVALVLMRADL